MPERCKKTRVNAPIDVVVNESITGAWDEVRRTTSTIDVQGVQIERIESVTFKLPTGAEVTLNFNNPGS